MLTMPSEPPKIAIHHENELLRAVPGEQVLCAIKKLLREDAHLFRAQINERSIVFRFGMYLQEQFPSYHVDCEYNRDGWDKKAWSAETQQLLNSLNNITANCDDTDGKSIFPDIIIHKRGQKEKNYLVIEVKKSTSQVDRQIDINKLIAFRDDPKFRYSHALFIEFKVGDTYGVRCVTWMPPSHGTDNGSVCSASQ